jgi:nucleotide-binding universal stress UspA family protein
MEADMTRTFSVLVASDLSEEGGYAFEQAVSLARRIDGADVHFAYVTDGDTSEARIRQLADQLRMYVSEKAASMGGIDGLRVGVHVRHGDPVPEIVQLAAELGAAVVVVGSPRRRHLKSVVLGSIAERLLAHAPCPVVVAGPKPSEAAPQAPTIEPVCPDCARARAQSQGRSWWCTRHLPGGSAVRGHVYSYEHELPFAQHDSEVVPTGIRF